MKFNTAYMENILEKYKIQIIEFFTKYKNILLLGIFTGIFVNAIDIFTIKYGIDAEYYIIQNNPSPYFDTQRYGSIILYYLFPFARFQIVSQLTGIIALTFAALLTISRHNISNTAKLLFVLLFITYPNFTFLQYFYFQSAYNFIGLLFVIIAYRLIETGKIYLYILAGILLFIGISSYQSNFAVFLTVMMINIILDFIEDKNYKKNIKIFILCSVILFFVCIIYLILIKIFSSNLNSYHSNFINISPVSLFGNLPNILVYIKDVLLSNEYNNAHTQNIIFTYILLLTIIIYIVKNKTFYEKIIFVIMILFFILFLFIIQIIMLPSYIPIRVALSLAFYGPFTVLLFYQIFSKNIWKCITLIIVFYVIIFQSYNIIKYQTSYMNCYEHDKIIAEELISKISNKYPQIYDKRYQIVFLGKIPFKPSNPLILLKDMVGYSVFAWDGGNGFRMLNFLKLHGFPENVYLGIISDEMDSTINKLSSYPDKNCIGLYKDTIIVKLR